MSKISSELTVNTQKLFDQSLGQTARLNNGGFVVTWVDWDSHGLGVATGLTTIGFLAALDRIPLGTAVVTVVMVVVAGATTLVSTELEATDRTTRLSCWRRVRPDVGSTELALAMYSAEVLVCVRSSTRP